jgi:Ser/Thr protein kinase RdoA (MazF antagonist)
VSVTAALAAHYDIAEATVLADVSDNVVQVATPRGELAVKLFVPADVERADREAALLGALADRYGRYRVQTVVPTADGAAVARTPQGAVLVTHWLRGEKKLYTAITGDEWRSLGNELAELHTCLDAFTDPLPRASELVIDIGAERAAIEASRGRVAAKDPGRAAAIGSYLDARLSLLHARGERGLRPPPGPERPIHNDYNQHNYLFDGVLPPIILDWEGAIAAPREYEVVRCLNHLPLVAPAHAAAFMDGYRSVRPLDRAALRWAVDRALLEHAIKSWPLERWLAGLPGAERSLAGSSEVVHALHSGVDALERFFGVEAA